MKTSSMTFLATALLATASQAGTTVSAGKSTVPPPMNSAPQCSPDISYTNFGASWIHGFGDADGSDGIGLDASFQLVPNFYFRGTAAWLSEDGGDFWGATLGAGYSFELAPNLHFVLEAGGAYDNVDLDEGGGSDDFGWYVFPHLRAKFACLEIHAGAKYLDVGSDQTWEGIVNLYYPVTDHVDFALGGGIGKDSQSLEVGLRYRF